MKQKQSSKDESDLKITVENTLQQKEDVKQMFPITAIFAFILKLMGQIDFIFSLKYLCRRNSSPKVYILTTKTGEKQPGQVCRGFVYSSLVAMLLRIPKRYTQLYSCFFLRIREGLRSPRYL